MALRVLGKTDESKMSLWPRRIQRQRSSNRAAVGCVAGTTAAVVGLLLILLCGTPPTTRSVAVPVAFVDAFAWTGCPHYAHYYYQTKTRPRIRISSRCSSSTCSNRRHLCGSSWTRTRLLLNRFLFDPSEVEPTTTLPLTPPVPTVTLPKDDYRTIHAAKILGLQNGDTVRAGIVSCSAGNDATDGADARTSNTTAATSTFRTRHGLLTDTATIQWILPTVGSVTGDNDQPSLLQDDGNNQHLPPGSASSLRIHLHSLQEPNHHTSSPSSSSSSDSGLLGVSLILALPRPLQLGRMLPMIAQMGVDHLVLMHATKVPRDYFGSHLLVKPHELTNRLVEGLCQAGTDVRLPTIHIVRPGRDYRNFWGKTDQRDDNMALLINRLFPKDEYARVVAHPQRVLAPVVEEGTEAAEQPPPPLPRMRNVQFPQSSPHAQEQRQRRKVVVAVGPEGGWAEPDELDMLVDAHGFQIITMGPRVLRSDCAVVSLLALAHDAVAAGGGGHG